MSKKLSFLLNQQMPDYVESFYPIFVIFVTKYFEWLDNSSTGVQYSIQNIELNRDVETTASNLAVQFLNTYMPGLPNVSAADDTILVKHFREFYKLKGSEQSFRYFFRAFFNEDVGIKYPRDVLFKPSDGLWYIEKNINVQSTSTAPVDLKHTYVTGATSRASAIVDRVVSIPGSTTSVMLYSYVLESIKGTFTSGEVITAIGYDYDNNTSTLISVTSTGTLITQSGRYLNDKSQLSSTQRLQDSYYYQQFSYVLRGETSRSYWETAIYNQLHPSGTRMFYEYASAKTATVHSTTSFSRVAQARASIRFPQVKSYLPKATFSFDRTGDYQTGTSATTTAGAISYTASYDYPGENITWALQGYQDGLSFGAVTEVARFDGATFDKAGAKLTLDSQIIAWPWDCNTSLVVRRYSTGSSNLAANTLLTAFSSGTITFTNPSVAQALTSNTQVGSMVLLLTWMKNSQGNNAQGESANAVTISLSSTANIIPTFDEETQRNLKRVALGQSLTLNNLIYYHSVTSTNTQFSVTSNGISGNIISSNGIKITFKPYNWERGQTYDRCAIRIAMAPSGLLLTSLTETFTTSPLTSNGINLIAAYSPAAAVSSTFTSTVASYYNFSSSSFVFNNPASTFRYLQTTSFLNAASVTASFGYFIGDNFNGGNWPEKNEDLVLQYSIDGGTNWVTSATIWAGGSSNVWTYGRGLVDGVVNTTTGNSSICGVNTSFLSDFVIGDRFYINSATTTTAYTVSTITDNTHMTVTPVLVDQYRSSVQVSARVFAPGGYAASSYTRIFGSNSGFFSTLQNNGFVIFNGTQGTSYTVLNIIDDTTVDVTPAFTNNFFTTTALTGPVVVTAGTSTVIGVSTAFTSQLAVSSIVYLGTSSVIRFGTDPTSSIYNTAYTVVSVTNNTSFTVTPTPVNSFSSLTTLTGQLYGTSGSTSVAGINTTFTSQLTTGQLVTIGTSDATRYTVVTIPNSTSITVSPALVTSNTTTSATKTGYAFFGSSQSSVGGIYTTFATDLVTGSVIVFTGQSTYYTVLKRNNDTSITVTPNLVSTLNTFISTTGTVNVATGGTTVTGSSTQFLTQFVTGNVILIGSSSNGYYYRIGSVQNNTSLTIDTAATIGTIGSVYYKVDNVTSNRFSVISGYGSSTAITGTSSYTVSSYTLNILNSGYNYWQILPINQQVVTTSITAYSGTTANVILRIIETSPALTDANQDQYAVDNLTVTSYSGGTPQGVINFGITVSSISTSVSALRINDNDFFDITTIGTL